MLKYINNTKSATLIELIVLILLIAIIASLVAGSVLFFVQMFVYSPRQMDAQKISQELSSTIFEGIENVRGVRYARSVIDASDTQFSYTYGYPTSEEELSVRFRWDATDKHFYRSTSTDGGSIWSAETVIPYYISSVVTIDNDDDPSVIFTYKKDDDEDWDTGDVDDIRRVAMDIDIKTGTGLFSSLEGSLKLTASAEIKNFQ